MKIGDRIYVRGYVDEIRKDTVIVRNDGGYFGTVLSEVTGELPSAQPDVPDINDGDIISRQAAIDALAKFVPYAICDESTESYTNGLTDAYNLICQLPSAQPEVIRCEDCKWRRNQNETMAWIPCRALVTPDDFYCKYAERKEQ